MLKIVYNGTDITDSVSVNYCVIERCLAPKTSNATIVFNDADKTGWSTWGVSIDDKLVLYYDNEYLGEYEIIHLNVSRGTYTLELQASAVEKQTTISKVWTNKSVKDILSSCADELSLTAAFFGDFSDQIEFLSIEKTRVYEYLKELGSLFGFIFIQDKDKIRFITYDYLTNTTRETWNIDNEDNYSFNKNRHVKTLVIDNGIEQSEANDDEGSGIIYKTVCGKFNLSRAAANMLREKNMEYDGGIRITTKHKNQSMDYPGKVIEVFNVDKHNIDGIYYVISVRINAGNREQVTELRRLR